MKRGNAVAVGIGAVSTLWIVLKLLPLQLDLVWWPSLLLPLVGIFLVAITDRRYGWSGASTLALVMCILPWAALIGFSVAHG